MYKRVLVWVLMVAMVISIVGCKEEPEEKPELLFYIGITMVKPVDELVKQFEAEHNCKINIIQGGSQDLYDSLKQSEKGDLYMPGSNFYRVNNKADGILLNTKLVGYNKAALMVAKGNPKGFTNDLKALTESKNKVVLCNPESGSIGRESKKILDNAGVFQEVFDNAVYLTTDSRNLSDALEKGDADICINWYATSRWEENVDYVDAIAIDEKYAKKKMLVLNLCKYSKYPELTRAFMEFAASEKGREVFMKYGFVEEEDLVKMDKVVIE